MSNAVIFSSLIHDSWKMMMNEQMALVEPMIREIQANDSYSTNAVLPRIFSR